MATLNYYLDRRQINKDGTSPLKIMVNTSQNNFMITMRINLLPSQWDKDRRLVIKHPKKAFLNSYLNDMLIKGEELLMTEQRKQGSALTKIQIKELMTSLFCHCKKHEGNVVGVFQKMINDTSKRKRTQEIYAVTLRKIEKFMGRDAESLTFEDITLKWLKKFEEWLMTDCPHLNARAIHFRNLRAVFNKALEDDLTTNYPFRKFKIGKEPTRKRALTAEQLRTLHNMQLKPYQEKYVDVFFLMFYLMGINGIDLLNATPDQVVNGRLEYKRAKTGTLYSVKLEPEALEIIKKYKGKKHLLKFCDKLKSYRLFMCKMNKCLDKLIPGCTSYYARHSAASIAAELDIPLDTIARMLGHMDSTRRVTLIYVDFNQNKVDEANRKVIDYVLYNKK
jgi:integrase